ncbi:MAG: proline--tRNA ligase, partial [Candidatus Amoebophilus sp.]
MKLSNLITKTRKEASSQDVSVNAQLLERAGYISRLMAGVYSFLPLGLRVLTNIENIIREEMTKLGGQEILMPALQPRENWNITDRWDKVDVLFKLKGAGDRDLCLGPTHEEIVTPLIGSYIQSYKDLPTAVYQIQTKFRNEPRSKSGLLRGREFRMKDLYSFHRTQEDLDNFYEQAKIAYQNIFTRCGLGDITYLTYASGGVFSKYSHEFQTSTQYGEDIIYLCTNCSIAINKELIEEVFECPQCKEVKLEEQKAIEVGNIFKLGTKFSNAFNLSYLDEFGKSQEIIMGCYGIGSSRLMGTIVEILHDNKG